MRRPAPILLLALAAQSCTCLDLPDPIISSVDPQAAPNAVDTPLAVLGDNFLAEIRVDFNDPSRSVVDASFSLELVHPDGRVFPLAGVTLVSESEIDAVLPAGASPQTYLLRLADPRGRTASLPNAVQVYQGNCAVNGSPCISGNPCTTGDTCQGHSCQDGPPLPDGTPCQLTCLAPGGETCQAGVCTLLPGGCP